METGWVRTARRESRGSDAWSCSQRSSVEASMDDCSPAVNSESSSGRSQNASIASIIYSAAFPKSTISCGRRSASRFKSETLNEPLRSDSRKRSRVSGMAPARLASWMAASRWPRVQFESTAKSWASLAVLRCRLWRKEKDSRLRLQSGESESIVILGS